MENAQEAGGRQSGLREVKVVVGSRVVARRGVLVEEASESEDDEDACELAAVRIAWRVRSHEVVLPEHGFLRRENR